MDLPDFLLVDDGGFIHLAAHRIGLHHVIHVYNEGYSPEMIAAHYPTLSMALIHKVIAFYLDNQGEADRYIAAHVQEMDRQIAATKPVSSLAELRRRLAQMQAAQSRAG